MTRRTSPHPVGAIERRNRHYGQRYIEALVGMKRRAKHRQRQSHKQHRELFAAEPSNHGE